jgi:ATP citrate (pro-S)-lyase
VNPLVVTAEGLVVPLDLAAKIDETAVFLCGPQWGEIDFPAPFGRAEFPEESYIRELDAKTGTSPFIVRSAKSNHAAFHRP